MAVRARVVAARERQQERLRDTPFHCNAELDGDALEALCRVDRPSRELLGQAMERLALSARGVHRALRVARTIADLSSAPDVGRAHIAEALTFKGYQA